MKKKNSKKSHGFSLLEVSAVIIIIGIMVAGVFAGFGMVTKFRLSAAEAFTRSSPISGITDNALWLETSLSSSFNSGETATGTAISAWNDQSNSANKLTITPVSGGPVYSNTINYVHAVEFKPSVGYLQFDASFLNKTDYTIFILEKRKSSGSSNYFVGAESSNANDSLALGYNSDTSVIHAQGSNSYNSYVSSYSDSKEKARLFVFSQSSTGGKKTYINGVLAAENAADTAQLSGLTTLSIGQGYTGEIGEMAIFTRGLKDEERKSVEDYLGKKWSRKVNRDSSAGCVGYTITDNGCDLSSAPCSSVSVAGVSSPVSAANGASGSLTCNALGYNGGSISYSCAGGSITAGTCGCATGYLNPSCATCDSANSYIPNGSGGCVISAPVNSVAPALSSSSPTVGTSLSVTNGTWSPTASSYTYQWYLDGTVAISGATSSSYTPVIGDVAHTLLCKVTASGTGGASTPTSSNTSGAVSGIPVNSVAPALSTTTTGVGTAITVTNGTWSPTPTSYTYQWHWADTSAAISGATSASYTPVGTDSTHTLLCKVVAINAAGSSSAVSSNTSLAVPASPILDQISSSTAAVAYSVRKIKGSYSGAALRVRRSSDNTQQDIGFTAAGLLDESALTTFVGGGNGFMVTWYDQSGNARNLTQATTSAQPTIVSSGTIVKRAGIPALLHDASDDGMTYGGSAYVTALPFSVNLVAGSSANTNTARRALKCDNAGSNWLIGPYNNQHSWYAEGWNHLISSPWTTSSFEVITVIEPSSGNPTSYRNGTSQTLSGTSKGIPQKISTGAAGAGCCAEPLNGYISEFVVFTVAISSTDRGILETNQMAYY